MAQASRLGLGGVYFYLLSTTLGAADFGVFVGSMAAIGIFYPFSGLGFGSILIKKVSASVESINIYYGNALLVTFITSVFLCLLIIYFAHIGIMSGISVAYLLPLVVGEIFFSKIVDVSSCAFQAVEKLHITAIIGFTSVVARLVGIFLFIVIFNEDGLYVWGFIYLLICAVLAIFSFFMIILSFGWPRFSVNKINENIVEGWHFAVGVSAITIYSNIDKFMLLEMKGAVEAGVYAVAYRLVSISFAPIQSLLAATYPSFFRLGSKSYDELNSYIKAITRWTIPYGLSMVGVLIIISFYVDVIFGAQYSDSAKIVVLLAFMPLIQSYYYPYADGLTGMGLQSKRSRIQIFIAFLNFVMNIGFIYYFGAVGAALSTMLSELMIMFLIKREFLIARDYLK